MKREEDGEKRRWGRKTDYRTERKREGLWVIKKMERRLLKKETINDLHGTKTGTTV